MGTTYALVNMTRRERIDFRNIGADTATEIAGHPIASAIVSWYMLLHRDDDVRFVGDTEEAEEEQAGGETHAFIEVTDRIVTELVERGILEDHGILWRDEHEPEIHTRDLRLRIWFDHWFSRRGGTNRGERPHDR